MVMNQTRTFMAAVPQFKQPESFLVRLVKSWVRETQTLKISLMVAIPAVLISLALCSLSIDIPGVDIPDLKDLPWFATGGQLHWLVETYTHTL